jgi:hypothetical protein
MVTGKDKKLMEKLTLDLKDKDFIIANLREELDITKNENYLNVIECSFEVDFYSLHAFSIERLIIPKSSSTKSDKEQTSIGYLVDGKIQEWIFSCSRETHERLAQEFKLYIQTNKKLQKILEE